MRKIFSRLAPVFLTGAMIIGGAQDNNNPTMDPTTPNPNHSSYPPSYQRNVVPNEPDLITGKSGSTYRLPASTPPTAPATSDPNAYPSQGSKPGY